MHYIHRHIERQIRQTLKRGKSILLLGPRQTGKTTLISNEVNFDIIYSLAQPEVRLRFEKNPVLFTKEIEQARIKLDRKILVVVDEIQKEALLMDAVQDLIDRDIAQFVLTGSSARKLKHGANINLLPGRVVSLILDPLTFAELPQPKPELEQLLLYGSLPDIINQQDSAARDIDLTSYVTTYLEEEVRAEALLRNIGSFARFLELAAAEVGIVNFSRMAQDIGVAGSTIASYYQVLEDCLIVNRIDPIIKSMTHRRLIRSPKYLFFDLGIRRACSGEGVKLNEKMLGILFEQFIGLELLRLIHFALQNIKLRYWHDSAGPEVDYVIDVAKNYIPIEVKWSMAPEAKDARHLKKFLQEYDNATHGYIVCRTPRSYAISENITAISWRDIDELLK